MHNFIIIDDDVDRSEDVARLLDLQGVVGDRHVPLLNIVQLLLELKLASCHVASKNLLEISLSLFWRFRLSDITEHVTMNA